MPPRTPLLSALRRATALIQHPQRAPLSSSRAFSSQGDADPPPPPQPSSSTSPAGGQQGASDPSRTSAPSPSPRRAPNYSASRSILSIGLDDGPPPSSSSSSSSSPSSPSSSSSSMPFGDMSSLYEQAARHRREASAARGSAAGAGGSSGAAGAGGAGGGGAGTAVGDVLGTMQDANTIEAYARQMTRRWRPGDVYAPHDMSPGEMARWRRAQPKKRDVVDMLGLRPLDMYRNFSFISEFMTSHGRVRKGKDTGLRPVNQRKVAKAIRRAIGLGIHPSVHRHPELLLRSMTSNRN
ncbi:hypothetical protein GGR56DRAFT_676805 [Xylariaceae sp. FL0804]|nr:hypothetical protein GGR56DRAFT_676805 [Xylariaceae sp. FL0804]